MPRPDPDGIDRSPELYHGTTVLQAWAPWCGSCRALAPVVDSVAEETEVTVVGLQVDTSPEAVDRFGIRSVPTLIALHDGVEVGRLVGLQPADAVRSLFDAAAGDGTAVRGGPPRSLVLVRAGAGAVVLAAGLAMSSVVLAVIGIALLVWSTVGAIRR